MSAKDDHDLFGQVADMLGLDEEETENFVTSAMRRRGHKPRIDWTDNDEGDGDKGGDFFTKKRQTRQVRPGGKGQQRSNDAGWQYG